MSVLKDVLHVLNDWSANTEDLRALNKVIVEMIRAKQREADAKAILNWQIGQKVSFRGRRNRTLTGEITGINRRTVTVKVVNKKLFGGNVEETTKWNVPASALWIAEQEKT